MLYPHSLRGGFLAEQSLVPDIHAGLWTGQMLQWRLGYSYSCLTRPLNTPHDRPGRRSSPPYERQSLQTQIPGFEIEPGCVRFARSLGLAHLFRGRGGGAAVSSLCGPRCHICGYMESISKMAPRCLPGRIWPVYVAGKVYQYAWQTVHRESRVKQRRSSRIRRSNSMYFGTVGMGALGWCYT